LAGHSGTGVGSGVLRRGAPAALLKEGLRSPLGCRQSLRDQCDRPLDTLLAAAWGTVPSHCAHNQLWQSQLTPTVAPDTLGLVYNHSSEFFLLDASLSLGASRYLVPFDPRQVPQFRFDVLVLGGGSAGGTAALRAAEAGASVAVLTKGKLLEGNTRWAKGGLAAVTGSRDSFDSHAQDTLDVGCGLSDPKVVQHVVRDGPRALNELLDLGAKFDREGNGDLSLSREGGHSHARIVHAHGDSTGIEIQRALTEALEEHPRIRTFERHFAIDLLSDPDGRVVGVLASNFKSQRFAFAAREVILATGGSGQLYRETTNPDLATGDGLAMGLRSGAVQRDLEFVQFHPTCLYIAGAARVLISEIVRGAGAELRDKNGYRFMPDHHPAAELAPRDVVSRAVFERMVATEDTSVYLHLAGLGSDPHRAFPAVSRIARFFGLDIAKDPIPVRPGAHYHIGGLAVDMDGRTSVPGLWAVGECASTNLHGANRIGSNSLLEGLVMGNRAGRCAANAAFDGTVSSLDHLRHESAPDALHEVELNLDDLTYSLKSLMWRDMGVQRSGPALGEALKRLTFWARAVEALPLESPRAWELINMLTVARLATFSALGRCESRGVHWRTDFPVPGPDAFHQELVPNLVNGFVEGVDLRRVAVTEAQLLRE